MHSSNLVINDQFSGAYARENLVTVECHVPKSELTSGYHAEYAKDSVGWHSWHTGTVASAIRSEKGIERKVLLSRWIKPVRIIPDSEVASMYQELLSGTNIAVPDNVVSPSLLSELKKIGVNIKESGKVTKNAADTGDVMFSKKNNTKMSATSPLSGSPATQGSVGMAHRSVTAAAEHLGINISVSQLPNSVKNAISVFSEIVDMIGSKKPIPGTSILLNSGNFGYAVISREMQTDDIEWRDSFISNYIDTYSGITRSSAVHRFVNQIWESFVDLQ